MLQIEPFIVWVDGQEKQADIIVVQCIYDNLDNEAKFEWLLYEDGNDPQKLTFGELLQRGNLIMSGDDYASWGDSGDINQEAYDWACDKLNIKLL